MNEVIFEVREDEIDGGYTASALGHGIHTQAETVEELRSMVRDAVDCYLDDGDDAPEDEMKNGHDDRGSSPR